ncbi:PspC domain-containing protein [Aquipuribacter sp. SD81]|uniref:PspC domain-containing protein n=1 Tax=Aquipuribacter sp. SD81 TaxID=3127703 RepID=UPI003018D3F8
MSTGTPVRGASERPPRPPLEREPGDRWVAGVASGVARHLGAPVAGVRAAFLVATLVAGIGPLVYLLLWVAVPRRDGVLPAGEAPRTAGGRGRRWTPGGEQLVWLLWGVGFLVAGAVLLLQRLDVAVPVGTVVPLAVVATGAFLTWSTLGTTERRRLVDGATGGTGSGTLRLLAGVGLAGSGILLLALTGTDAQALRPALLAGVAVLGGVGLLVAPTVLTLWRRSEAERLARVRETERAAIAAHLHDSVLQTLALIQRRPDDPQAVARLARAQERELRGWLYGDAAGREGTLASAVADAVAQVEDDHGVPVEVVQVGDCPLDDRSAALVAAAREAVLNAVRHARPPVQVYVEVADGEVRAFVTDRGDGLDLADLDDPERVPPDRLGLRESVLGRMRRAGGSAGVRRAPGGGTEVSLHLPLHLAAQPAPPAQPARPADPAPRTTHAPQEDA